MKCLVTGGTGFIGAHLIEHLIDRKQEIIALVRRTSNLKWLSGLNLKFIYGDCRDKISLYRAFENINEIDIVFHLAAIDRAIHHEKYYRVNFEGTKNLLEICQNKRFQLKRFIYISSIFATGPSNGRGLLKEDIQPNPITHYGKSKLLAEKEVLKYRNVFPVVIIRPSAVYGPRDRNMYTLIKLLNKKLALYFGEINRLFSVCFIKDLINGLLLAAEKDYPSGEIFFIADFKVYTLKEIIETIANILEVNPYYIKIPLTYVKIGSLMMEKCLKMFNRSTTFNLEKNNERMKNWACDISKAKKMLGFEPKFDFRSGMEITVKWYKNNKWL